MFCRHQATAEVIPAGSEEVVALICEACLQVLPIWHHCGRCEREPVYVVESLDPIAYVMVEPCGRDHRIPQNLGVKA